MRWEAVASPLSRPSGLFGAGRTQGAGGTFRVTRRPELRDELGGVEADGLGDFQELDDVQPAFTALVLGDEGLGAIEAGSDVPLPEVGLDTSLP